VGKQVAPDAGSRLEQHAMARDDRIPKEPAARLAALLAEMSENRAARFREVVSQRMDGLTVVLEGLYDPGNRSAVYRTAEANGLLDVHVVNPDNAFKRHARQVSRGAEKWIHIHEWETAQPCVSNLKSRGYDVLVADLSAARPLRSIDFSRKVALVFGNERDGITEEMRELSDGGFILPMRGFAQSYNISVAAALAVSQARQAREQALGTLTDLDPQRRDALLMEYAERGINWLREAE
jgi:tRNA (guanosine-2'-O-)-methyltransferase